MHERPPFPPALALLTGVLAVSTGAIFARLADAPAIAISCWRCGLATLVVLPFARREMARELPAAGWRTVALGLAAGALLALHFGAWIRSLELTSVAASVLLVNTSPVWVALLGPLLTRERTSRRTAAGIALSVLGVALLALGERGGEHHGPAGDALALLGGLAMGLYLLAGRRLRASLGLTTYVGLCYGSAAAWLLLFGLAAGVPLVGFSGTTWVWIAASALVPQLLGHGSCNFALKWVKPAVVASALLGEPIAATLLAWLFLGERPGPELLAAAPAVLLGIHLAAGSVGEADAAAGPGM